MIDTSDENVVTITRGAIVSVVTANGSILASPEYALLSKFDRRVRFNRATKEGKPLKPGQIVAWQGNAKLVAPTDGALVRRSVYEGMRVEVGIPVAVIKYGGFAVQADLPAVQAFRLFQGAVSARVQVTGGPGPTTCRLVEPVASGTAPTISQADPAGETAAPVRLMCLLPAKSKVRAGLPAVLALNTGERKNVLLAPARAVAGDASSGIVTRLLDGNPVRTPVKLGISDGVNVEIVEGLAEGDQILSYGPNLRTPIR